MISWPSCRAGPMFLFIQESIHLVDDLDETFGVPLALCHLLQAAPSLRFVCTYLPLLRV